ncbi:16S rRNA m(3)U-1498 methyltransferase [Halospina denitrificans]|uniref:Ribosomal RNA small subunit methyltransferase E n=1 Tax=Halospina denitrificans TaxID=332522 RepID=A0A4R7JY15_9GAMM|nr:16S rRNA (uracil(1498)-N(3))-methyltransferase [Halospina denitrificans]TDT43401.1 16S rRNA m(3)U-1498 methyltransferase [Halospina denitrificans]
MRIPRIYTEQTLTANTEQMLTGNAAHHAGRVLRMEAGQWLTLFNGDGLDYHAEILEAGRKSLQVRITESEAPGTESPLIITLGQVMSRGDRMDYAIQKATELGVTHIQPLTSDRCEVKLSGDRERKRVANWQQVAISAAEQCGRARIPDIAPPIKLGDWLSACNQDLRLVLHDQGRPLGRDIARPDSIALLVGPEGGLASPEIEAAHNAGFLPLALGPRVMRTETAPVAALSLCQWLWGDFHQSNKAETA